MRELTTENSQKLKYRHLIAIPWDSNHQNYMRSIQVFYIQVKVSTFDFIFSPHKTVEREGRRESAESERFFFYIFQKLISSSTSSTKTIQAHQWKYQSGRLKLWWNQVKSYTLKTLKVLANDNFPNFYQFLWPFNLMENPDGDTTWSTRPINLITTIVASIWPIIDPRPTRKGNKKYQNIVFLKA